MNIERQSEWKTHIQANDKLHTNYLSKVTSYLQTVTLAQGMNMREAVDNSRNRRIWRSLVEASSSANAWRRRNWSYFRRK